MVTAGPNMKLLNLIELYTLCPQYLKKYFMVGFQIWIYNDNGQNLGHFNFWWHGCRVGEFQGKHSFWLLKTPAIFGIYSDNDFIISCHNVDKILSHHYFIVASFSDHFQRGSFNFWNDVSMIWQILRLIMSDISFY